MPMCVCVCVMWCVMWCVDGQGMIQTTNNTRHVGSLLWWWWGGGSVKASAVLLDLVGEGGLRHEVLEADHRRHHRGILLAATAV